MGKRWHLQAPKQEGKLGEVLMPWATEIPDRSCTPVISQRINLIQATADRWGFAQASYVLEAQ